MKPVWTARAYRRLVLLSAGYDLVVTAPFATPWSFGIARDSLSQLNMALGAPALPSFGVLPTLFAVLMGSLVLVWSVLRLRSPERRFGRYDGLARMLFASWMAWAWTAGDTPVLGLFFWPELAWGLAQWAPVAAPQAAQPVRELDPSA